MLRKLRCVHEWHELKRYYAFNMLRSTKRDYRAIIYCPLCEKQRNVSQIKADIIRERQRIRERYADELRIY